MGLSVKNAFIGVGLGNFSNSFTRFRPSDFNQNNFWFLRFDQSAAAALTCLTEQGLMGIFFWAWFFYLLYKMYRGYRYCDQEFFFNRKERRLIMGFFILAVAWLFIFLVPLPFPMFSLISPLFFTFLLLLLFFFAKKKLVPHFSLPFFVLPIALTSLISLILLFFIFSSRNSPNMLIRQSQEKLDRAVAAAETPKPDREKIRQLVSESIAAATRATKLNPNNSSYHHNLAQIGTHLTSIVDKADKLATDEFKQALALDPYNPKLYLDFGSFQYKQGDYYAALNSFNTAVYLKNNYAPALFALGQLYEKLAQTADVIKDDNAKKTYEERSKNAFKKAENVVCLDELSEDCRKVKKELNSTVKE
jgi:tetratricopeptide (TPR) repeat protein